LCKGRRASWGEAAAAHWYSIVCETDYRRTALQVRDVLYLSERKGRAAAHATEHKEAKTSAASTLALVIHPTHCAAVPCGTLRNPRALSGIIDRPAAATLGAHGCARKYRKIALHPLEDFARIVRSCSLAMS
jgi:hypothetical protein